MTTRRRTENKSLESRAAGDGALTGPATDPALDEAKPALVPFVLAHHYTHEGVECVPGDTIHVTPRKAAALTPVYGRPA